MRPAEAAGVLGLVVALPAVGVGFYLLGRSDERLDRVAEAPCPSVGKLVTLEMAPEVDQLLERRRGDRWVRFEVREVPRPRPVLAERAR